MSLGCLEKAPHWRGETEMLRATVSGSFHRHMIGIYDAVGTLRELGVDILSPSDPRVVDNIGEFLFVASDRLRSIKLVQDRHYEAIRNSDFLWVVCPDGYVGPSTASEIGAAHVLGVPVFSDALPNDITIKQYVYQVTNIGQAAGLVQTRGHAMNKKSHVLLDPNRTVETAIQQLELLKESLHPVAGQPVTNPELALQSTRKYLTRHIL